MGGSFFFFVESKPFEFSVEEGGTFFSLRIFERGKNSLRSVFMGKECAKRLLSMLEDFISTKTPGHFARTVRDGETVFILQLGYNAHGSFLMISEFLRSRQKGFIVVPKGNLGCGWRGFGFHLRKALALGTPAINLPPKLLPGSEYKASKSFAAAVVQGRRNESQTHRQVAVESSQYVGTRGHKGKHLMLDTRNSNSANPGFQTLDSRASSLGKENAQSSLGKENIQIGAEISPVSSDDSEDGVILDLFIKLERGPHGKWGISWSKVSEVDPSVGQASNPKPIDFNKPNHKLILSAGLIPNPKPFDFIKPKVKPVFKWKPKPSQPSLTKYQTYPHSKYPSQPSLTQHQTLPHSKLSSQVNPSHLISSEASKAGSDNADAKHSLTHLEPACTEVFLSVLDNSIASSQPFLTHFPTLPHSNFSSKVNPSHLISSESSKAGTDKAGAMHSLTHLEPACTENFLSVLDNFDASMTESLCSDASVDESLCSDGDVALQRDIQLIINEHTDNVIKKWGNSEQWVLELWDGKRVAVPIHISLPSGDVAVGVDVSNQLAMVPEVSSESKEFNSELEKGVDGFVEDWASDFCSKDALQFTDSSPPLNVEPLAFSLPRDGKDISEGSATRDVEKLLGKFNYSEWFQEKFSGFDDFLGTSLKGLEEPATKFLLAVEAEL